jgi:hypothetical protein
MYILKMYNDLLYEIGLYLGQTEMMLIRKVNHRFITNTYKRIVRHISYLLNDDFGPIVLRCIIQLYKYEFEIHKAHFFFLPDVIQDYETLMRNKYYLCIKRHDLKSVQLLKKYGAEKYMNTRQIWSGIFIFGIETTNIDVIMYLFNHPSIIKLFRYSGTYKRDICGYYDEDEHNMYDCALRILCQVKNDNLTLFKYLYDRSFLQFGDDIETINKLFFTQSKQIQEYYIRIICKIDIGHRYLLEKCFDNSDNIQLRCAYALLQADKYVSNGKLSSENIEDYLDTLEYLYDINHENISRIPFNRYYRSTYCDYGEFSAYKRDVRYLESRLDELLQDRLKGGYA